MFLSLDLGTIVGWAADDGRLILSGTIKFKPTRFEGGGMRFVRFKEFLSEMKAKHGPIEAIYFEEVRNHKGVDAAHIYGGFLAMLSAWCEYHKIPYLGVPVGQIKQHATGKGNAGKPQMIAAAEARGHRPKDDNEADAIAIAYCRRDGI